MWRKRFSIIVCLFSLQTINADKKNVSLMAYFSLPDAMLQKDTIVNTVLSPLRIWKDE